MSDASAASQISEVEPRALASFTRQLGAMLHAGVDVLRALRIASNHSGDARLLEASVEISRLLQDGRELHAALARHPELFGPFYVEMARQGEQDGTLGQVLLSVAEYLEGLADAQAPPPAAQVAVPASLPAPAVTPLAAAAGTALVGAGAAVLVHAIGLISAAAAAALALLWSGATLLYVSSQQRGTPTPAAPRPVPTPPDAPPKSPERRQAETEGIVRTALLEQEEEQEQHPPDPASAFRDPFGDAEPLLSDELTRKPG